MNQQSNNEEIDIIQFFSAVGNLFKGFFRSIGKMFKRLFYFFADILLYFKKYRIILSIGFLLGLAISFFSSNDTHFYYGETTLRTNFNAQMDLQEKVDALNDLIRNNNTVSLGKMLDIPAEQAAVFTGFYLEPVVNDLFLIEDYENYLTTKDTVVYKYIEYDDYKKNILKNDNLNRYWKLTVKTTSPDIFNTLNQKIINLFNNDLLIKKRKQLYLSYLDTKKQNFIKSLQDIDTMRKVFNKAWLQSNTKGGQSISFMLSNENSSNGSPEEAYNLFEERKTALIDLKKTIEEINKSDNAVVILNSFPHTGIHDKSLLDNKHFKFAFIGFLLALMLLLLKDFNAFLNRYEKQKTGKQ